MKSYSVGMALVDLIPTFLFLFSILIILKDTKNKMKGCIRVIYIVGTFMVFAAGFIKALYKLLYALNVGDFEWMSNQFFSNQSLGFLLAGIAMLFFAIKSKNKVLGLIPTMGLVGIMVAGLGLLDAGYITLASRLKKKGAIVCFAFSFVFCLMMGYLSSKDFTQSYMNWAAELINCLGQGLLFAGCKSLSKAGLKDM